MKKTMSMFSWALALVAITSSVWPVSRAVADPGGDLVVSGETVVLSGVHEYDNVEVINNGVLKVDSSEQWLELNVTGEVFVESGSKIVANDMSSEIGDGGTYTGLYSIAGGGGAGYGGSGGQGDTRDGIYFDGGPAYGDPTDGGGDTGSEGGMGGAGYQSGGAGGLGGGRLTINASVINIEGSIEAYGGAGTYPGPSSGGGGGGSGGGITLTANTVIIGGTVSADGGKGAAGYCGGGGGAGGRITIICGNKEISGQVIASGGLGGISKGLSAIKGSGDDGENGSVTFINSNQPPALNPVGDKSVEEGQTLSFVVTATDPDNDDLTLTATNLPPDATFIDNLDNTGSFSWTTDYDDAGSYVVTFVVFDGSLTDSEDITITVLDNEIPSPQTTNDYIQNLSDDAFSKNPDQRRNSLENNLEVLFYLCDEDACLKKGGIQSAINKLQNDIRTKMDGQGEDWIIDPTAQQELCAMIDTLVAHLQTKL